MMLTFPEDVFTEKESVKLPRPGFASQVAVRSLV
jgi:hypothetical protein